MVNIAKRESAAKTLERFLNCEITNEDFMEAFPQDRDDPALLAVGDVAWFCYSEDRTHKLAGKHEPPAELRHLLENAVLFLQTELEYEWPPYRFVSLKNGFLKLLGMRSMVERQFEEFKRAGDWEVWPFLRRSDYTEASNRAASIPGTAAQDERF